MPKSDAARAADRERARQLYAEMRKDPEKMKARSAKEIERAKARREKKKQERVARGQKSRLQIMKDYRLRKKEEDPEAYKKANAEKMRKSRGKKAVLADDDAQAAIAVLGGLAAKEPAGPLAPQRKSGRLQQMPRVHHGEGYPRMDFRWVKGRGWCVFADQDVTPGTVLFPYGGTQLKSAKTVNKLALGGMDKIVKIRDKKLWYDGSTSTTYGPYVSHACDCEANAEMSFDRKSHSPNMPLITSLCDDRGRISKGDEILMDYCIKWGDAKDDPRMKWLSQYKCRLCGKHSCEDSDEEE